MTNYLGCEIQRDCITSTTCLSQRHYAEDVLCTFSAWNSIPVLTPMRPNTCLSKDNCDLHPDRAFRVCYCGIVGSLGYLVNMTHPDLAWAYSELSKFFQYPGDKHCDTWLLLSMSFERIPVVTEATKLAQISDTGINMEGLSLVLTKSGARASAHLSSKRGHPGQQS
jgi:hypothetical protein